MYQSVWYVIQAKQFSFAVKIRMSHSDFIDSIRVFIRSGKGGSGSVHFHRSKLTDKGGPDGGDGGRGGHIILEGNENLWTLHHLRFQKHILAQDGENGAANRCFGKDGEDVVIQVPLGTVAIDEQTNVVDIDIVHHQQRVIWQKGGKGGLGNVHFANAVRKAPTYAQPGLPGWEGWKRLELKVLADVGMVGFPNAGKSTLLSVMSSARPKIAAYPFTTLVPQLGIVSADEQRSFCMADLPGIIEGASEGKGLGHRFLRHVERNVVLAFVISLESTNVLKDFKILQSELKKFNPLMLEKEILVILSKTDLVDDKVAQKAAKQIEKLGFEVNIISAATMKGIADLKTTLWKKVSQAKST